MARMKKRLQGKARNQREVVTFCVHGHLYPHCNILYSETVCGETIEQATRDFDRVCGFEVYQARIPRRLQTGLHTVLILGGLDAVRAYLKPFRVEPMPGSSAAKK